MEYRKQNKIANRNINKIIQDAENTVLKAITILMVFYCYFYLNTSLQKYTVIRIKQESFHAATLYLLTILKLRTFFFYFNCIGLVSQEKVFLSYKFFCIKKIHRLIQVLCFLEIVTRYRKEVDATKLQKIVQIVFIKEKKEGRQVRKELFRTGKLF